MSDRVVLKVGGSLLDWPALPARLQVYLAAHSHERHLLVIGGGPFAKAIRDLDRVHALGESRSHQLALRAMGLSAHLVHALLPSLRLIDDPTRLPASLSGHAPIVLHPDAFPPLGRWPETWEMTSDSLAARLAYTLGADDLRLLKSRGVDGASSRAEAMRIGLVDPCFAEASAWCPRVSVVNLRAGPPTVEWLD